MASRILSTAVDICGRAKGSPSDLRAGSKKASMTSSLIMPLEIRIVSMILG
jgi:hypothetical protein